MNISGMFRMKLRKICTAAAIKEFDENSGKETIKRVAETGRVPRNGNGVYEYLSNMSS